MEEGQRIGAYRIVEKIGEGGMGEVYRAHDEQLERSVAIKLVRSAIPDETLIDARFRREARAVAQVNHPTIVQIYHVLEWQDRDCIVMEWVDGRTLTEILRHGPLELQDALRLAREICEGLAAAHAQGIIHRDLKAGNVMVTAEGHVKILDFGLAKLTAQSETSLSLDGQLIGTPESMSPEQVLSEPIDQRSDLFSFGTLFYRMLSGHSPFRGDDLRETLTKICNYHQPPVRKSNPEVPEPISDLIDELLNKAPEDRPESAEDVLAVLEVDSADDSEAVSAPSEPIQTDTWNQPRSESDLPSAVAERTTPSPADETPPTISALRKARPAPPIVKLIGMAIGTLILVALNIGVRACRSPDPEAPLAGQTIDFQERDRVILADFENKTDDPNLDQWIAYLFRVGLEQSPHARILPKGLVRGVLDRMQRDPDTTVDRDLGLEICRREGAKVLVVGSIFAIGDIYTLTGSLLEARSGDTIYSTTRQASSQQEIISAVEALTRELRVELGESLDSIERTLPLERVTTKDIAALDAYTLAVEKIDEGDVTSALDLFEQAIRLDPEFAMAHARIAAYWIYSDLEKATIHLDAAARHSDRLPHVEKLYVDGWSARARGKPNEEARIWSLLSELYPDHFIGHMNVGMTLWLTQYRFAEAAEAFRKASSVRPPEASLLSEARLGYCQLALGRIDDDLLTTKAPILEDLQLDSHLVRKNYAEALKILEGRQATSRQERLSRLLRKTFLAADQGHFEQAIEEAIELEKLGYDRMKIAGLLTILTAQETLGREAAIPDALRRSEELTHKILAESPRRHGLFPFLSLVSLGQLYARHGRLDLLDTILTELQPAAKGLAVWESYLEILQASRAAARGDDREAVGRLERSLTIAETWRAHADLAAAYRRLGEIEAAITHYVWLVDHRGRTFVECGAGACQIVNIVDWVLAHDHLGRLHEEIGDRDKALDWYKGFVDHWSNAQDLPAWQEAQRRIVSLENEASAVDDRATSRSGPQ